jgi:hypothetical protein
VKTIAGAAATGTVAVYTAELPSAELLTSELEKIPWRYIIKGVSNLQWYSKC